MNIRVSSDQLSGSIAAIPSKSAAHRALICAALSDKPCRIDNIGNCSDIMATTGCLNALGADIAIENNSAMVVPVNNCSTAERAVLDCRDSGSTLRFLLPVAAALGKSSLFTGCGRLGERPIDELLNQLICHGITVGDEKIAEISGKLTAGEFILSGSVSSQFLTGLLLALPLLGEDSEIRLTTPLQSAAYVDMTIATLERFGIKVEQNGGVYRIDGSQKLTSSDRIFIEGDWSNAAFWLVAGALNGDIEISGLDTDSLQGDREILPILKRMGADISVGQDGIRVKKSELTATEIDAKNIPDLVPILAVAASGAKGTTAIHNVERLRLKESDRLKAIIEMITALGGKAYEENGSLFINGNRLLEGGVCDSFNDHRMAMSAAVAALICKNSVVINNAECIAKSYPDFFKDMKKLAGNVENL